MLVGVFMCKEEGENVDHLLLHCRVALSLEVWWEIAAWFGMYG